MKKLKTFKSKIIMFLLALVLPLSASGIVYTFFDVSGANAENQTSTYSAGHIEEVSLSNNNFNSVSSYSISTSLTGWSGLNNDKSTTAGIINTNTTFPTYMQNTYRLANNPSKKGADSHVLMINSKTETSTKNATARQGYRSSTVTLAANSYYSFQVSFKSDTNYESFKSYVEKGIFEADQSVSKSKFESVDFGKHFSISYRNQTVFVPKTITSTGSTLGENKTNIVFFYEDSEYVGLIHNGQAIYVSLEDVEETIDPQDDTKKIYSIASTAETFTSNLAYNESSKNYTISATSKYFEEKTEYKALGNTVFGSAYINGLKDEKGNPIKAEFVKISSNDWETFYFFIATGNEQQQVTMDLWLGTNENGNESSGVAFFDDCHIFQYSENMFWKTYASYMNKSFDYQVKDDQGNHVSTKTIKCTNLTDLRNDTSLHYDYNLDFEKGIYNNSSSSLENWTAKGSKNARVFNVNNPETFKSITGYDFVGSTLSCEVEIEGETITLSPNKYVLGMWANEEYVGVESEAIKIDANEVYKITAKYKVSEVTSGNVYLTVKENNFVLENYGLKEEEYYYANIKNSEGVKSNGTNAFNNNYATIEFYVQGGPRYNSEVTFELSLGKDTETATGCVVFDEIKIEKATSAEADEATNLLVLASTTKTTKVLNGNFNNVTVDDTFNYPLAPKNWTITQGNGITFGGVINTETAQYDKYKAQYTANSTLPDAENPYLWATYKNPGNPLNKTTDKNPENILMLTNFNSSWQKTTSDQFDISANQAYMLAFDYKTFSNENITVSVYGSDGFKLYEKEITSGGSWKNHQIYLKTFEGADKLTVSIELGTEKKMVVGSAYLDNFELTEIASEIFTEKKEAYNGSYGIVDMDNFYFDIPTNNITDNISTSTPPAYTGSVASGEKNTNLGAIVSGEFLKDKESLQARDVEGNVFYFTNQAVGSYTIQSNFNFDLTAEESTTYYELSFDLKTYFEYLKEGSNKSLDEDKSYKHGLTIGLTGFEYLTGLTSNEEYQNFKIYFKVSEATSAKLYMSFVSDYSETLGAMALYNLSFTTVDEKTYNTAKETFEGEDYSLNSDRVHIAEVEAETDSDTSEDEDAEDTEETDDNGNFEWLLLISTLITGLAIIIAIVGYFMRKVKIKKIQKTKKATYDRKKSLDIDRIKRLAREQIESEIEKVNANLNKFETELESLEKEHKQKVIDLRAKDKGKVSKDTDKEFKRFAQKRTVIAEKIASLKKQIESLKSPEYLIGLEKKIYAQEEAKRKELLKESKKLNKNNEKRG
ncbi:MAG: hypothetical protein E7375_01160 [Clostridiales bacterium]|nr:hypothetical protein [Clostridiales bacterium]